MNKLRVFEAFAGIGTQRMALKRLGINHEVIGISEIDKFAIKSYEAIHGETKNFGDITQINTDDLPGFDLFTYSFPCQDISVAGHQKGLDKGSETRSSLLWECERIIKDCSPKYLLMENVKNLVGKKHIHNFEKWLEILEEYGYINSWQVLNAKDYGIPQNRERVFCVSILNDGKESNFTTKTTSEQLELSLIGDTPNKSNLKAEPRQKYKFPEKRELKTRLKDLLEDEVDEKFYLSEEQINRIKFSTYNAAAKRIQEKEYSDTLCARDYKGPKCIKCGDFRYDEGLRIRKNGLSPCLTTKIGSTSLSGNKLIIKNSTKKGYIEASEGDGIDLSFPESKTRRGRVQKDCSQTLTCNNDRGVVTDDFRIRKLTPLECWRLMGVEDECFYKAEKVNSNSQLYKQAGNAIVVDVLEAIFKNLFVGD